MGCRAFLFVVFLIAGVSCFSQEKNEQPVLINELIDFDGVHYINRAEVFIPVCDSCEALNRTYKKQQYNYFMKLVYEPALKNPLLSAGNKAFLEKLKAYLACKGVSCSATGLIRSVFQLSDILSGENAIRIIDELPGSKKVIKKDTTTYRLVYSNFKKIMPHKILKAERFVAHGETYNSYTLKRTRPENKLKPAFCTPFDLELEYVNDKKMDTLLYNAMKCNNACTWSRNGEDEQVTFAKLKGVPRLYFTCSVRDDDWASNPARGMFINVGNQYALELWKFFCGSRDMQ